MEAAFSDPVSIPNYPLSMPLSFKSFELGGGGSGVFKCCVTPDPPEAVTAYFQLHLGPPDYLDSLEGSVWCFPAPEGAIYGGQMLEVRPASEVGLPGGGDREGIRTFIHVSLVFFPGPRDPDWMLEDG